MGERNNDVVQRPRAYAVRVTNLKAYKIDDFASSTNSASPLLICQDTTCSKDLKRSEMVSDKYLCRYVSQMIEFFPVFLYVQRLSLRNGMNRCSVEKHNFQFSQ